MKVITDYLSAVDIAYGWAVKKETRLMRLLGKIQRLPKADIGVVRMDETTMADHTIARLRSIIWIIQQIEKELTKYFKET